MSKTNHEKLKVCVSLTKTEASTQGSAIARKIMNIPGFKKALETYFSQKWNGGVRPVQANFQDYLARAVEDFFITGHIPNNSKEIGTYVKKINHEQKLALIKKAYDIFYNDMNMAAM